LTQTLEVLLGNYTVGYLSYIPNDRTVFAFSSDYREDPDRPTLSQSFLTADGGLVDDPPGVHRLAPPYFSNLLPEGTLRGIIARQLDVAQSRDFPLLSYLGGDLPGAVILNPSTPLEPVSEDALRFSLPGVQLKLSALLDESRGSLTIPARGQGGDWILKLASAKYPELIDNEHSMMRFASHIGMPVPEVRLVDLRDIKGIPAGFESYGPALAVRRFDRTADGARIHAEDFNQAFGQFPEAKYHNYTYGDVAQLLVERVGQSDVVDMIRRVVFNAAIGNGDMHLKNWSLIYSDGRTPKLSPAYDLVSTLPYPVDQDLALSFGGEKGRRSLLNDARLRSFAKGAQLPYAAVRKVALSGFDIIYEGWRTFAGPIREDLHSVVQMEMERFAKEITLRRPAKAKIEQRDVGGRSL